MSYVMVYWTVMLILNIVFVFVKIIIIIIDISIEKSLEEQGLGSDVILFEKKRNKKRKLVS